MTGTPGPVSRFLRVARTARHLTPRQAAAWIRRWLNLRRGGSTTISPAEAEAAERDPRWPEMRSAARGWSRVPEPVEVTLAMEGRYRFLNRERQLHDIDWTVDYESPLWTYHLHYLDVAVDLARAWQKTADPRLLAALADLWTSWLSAAERGKARIEPYPTSVRSMNALETLWLVEDEIPADLFHRLLAATGAQLDWLAEHLEHHLDANHLQRNLTALAWGALAFAGERGSRRQRHLPALWEQSREQVLPDGGHFERSPMYHGAALNDFLRTLSLCRAAGATVPADVPGRLTKMTRAYQWMSRPDGTLHLLNDAANGQRPARNEVMDLARRVLHEEFPEPTGSFALPATGYFGLVDVAEGTRLIIDAGPPGPAHQPGHAHCDMLSFELDVDARRVIVDSGLHGYDGDPYREYVRSTRAHNTVAVDDRDQHEMWATFRVARRGRVIAAEGSGASDGRYAFRGACRPYHDRRLLHQRRIQLGDRRLDVTDSLTGAVGRSVSSWLHLHPDLQVERVESKFVARVAGSEVRVVIEPFGGDSVRIRRGESAPPQGWYCPEFGLARPAPVLELRREADDGREFGWRVDWS